jgi:hypothetical protein
MSVPGLNIFEPADLTAADLLGRRSAVAWYEAVAIVRAVSELVSETAEPLHRIPELNQIHISSVGSIDVSGAVVAKDPVRRMGQILHALIAQSDPPVQLRLVISQATAPEPLYNSVREYWEALAYFERPQREALLRALYARAVAAPVGGEATGSPSTFDDLSPLQQWSALSEGAPLLATRTRLPFRMRFIASAILIMLGLAATVGYLRMRGIAPRTRTIAHVVTQIASGAAVSGMSAITERLGLGRLAPATTAQGPPAITETRRSPASALKQTSHLLKAEASSFAAFDLQPDTPPAVVMRDNADSASIPSEQPVPPRVVDDDAMTYGPDSEGVTPPVGIRPQLPRELPDGVEPKHLGRIEFVVRGDGTVESVKFLGQPRDVIDTLFLSVAKAWRFQPAMKNGMPVRYRKTIWIAAQ